MKHFNLKEALSGKPVRLRGGQKAIIYYRIPDEYTSDSGEPFAFPLLGIILDTDNTIEQVGACWRDNGTFGCAGSTFDIVGMYEEPPKSQEEILEDAWRKKGKVVKTDAGFITIVEVVGKTSDGEYIVRNPATSSLDEISVYGKLNWRPYEEPKGPMLNPKLALLHLPKPSKPMQGERYYYIDTSEGKFYVENGRYSHTWSYDRNRREQGNCFSSELDAQAWIHALNYARTGEVTIC